MTQGHGVDGVIQFWGKGRYRTTSHLAEIENQEQFHICVLQKHVLCKTSIFLKLKKKLEDFSLMSVALTLWNDFD